MTDRRPTLDDPASCRLVVLVGISGSGKSTFARRHFRPTEVISSDFCRGLVADDENDQAATAGRVRRAALHRRQAAGGRPADRGRRHQRPARGPRRRWSQLAREHDVLPVAIVLDLPGAGLRRAQRRPAPTATSAARCVRRQRDQLRRGAARAGARGLPQVHVLRSVEEVDAAPSSPRAAATTTCATSTGPFDVIGDVHGCRAELEALLGELGYALAATTRAGRSTPSPRRAGGPSSSATWSTAARTPPACCGW